MSDEEKLKKVTLPLNIMLIKESYEFNEKEKYIKNYDEKEVKVYPKREDAFLYFREKEKDNEPQWVKQLEKLGFPVEIIQDKTYGATLFLKISGRIFAINFGTLGRYHIEETSKEKYFGLKTVSQLLLDEKAAIKRSSSRANGTNPVSKVKQHGIEIEVDDFLLDRQDNEVTNELVISSNDSKYKHIIGKSDTLKVQFSLEVPEQYSDDKLKDELFKRLIKSIDNILELYTRVNDNNEDILNILFKGAKPVTDEDQIDNLDNMLIKKLNDTNQTDFYLFEAEVDFDVSEVDHIKYKTNNQEYSSNYDQLLLSDYCNTIGKHNPLTLEQLKEDKVTFENSEGMKIKEWTIYRTLYGEMFLNDKYFILSNEEWYEVNKEKYNDVENNIKQVLSQFPIKPDVIQKTKNKIQEEATKKKKNNTKGGIQREHIFNDYLKDGIGDGGYLFDEGHKQLNLYGDGKFEICDVYDANSKEFIHVKRGSTSGPLSYLFNQGFVSARAYIHNSTKYADGVNVHIDDNRHKISPKPNSDSGSTYTIRYLIVDKKENENIPFFSKLVLDNIIRELKGYHYDVKVSWLQEDF